MGTKQVRGPNSQIPVTPGRAAAGTFLLFSGLLCRPVGSGRVLVRPHVATAYWACKEIPLARVHLPLNQFGQQHGLCSLLGMGHWCLSGIYE